MMNKLIPLFLLAGFASAGAQTTYGGLFGAAAPGNVIANVVIGTTQGNPVPADALGISFGIATDALYLPSPPTSGAVYNAPCGTAANPCWTSPYAQLIDNLTGSLSLNRPLNIRLEGDPEHAYAWQSANVPIGLPITGGWSISGNVATLTTNNLIAMSVIGDGTDGNVTLNTSTGTNGYTGNISWGIVRPGSTCYSSAISGGSAVVSATTANAIGLVSAFTLGATVANGTAAMSCQALFAANGSHPADTVYAHSFSSSAATTAGLNNPATPHNVTTPYTITSANATTITFAIPYSGTQSGTENGYLTLSAWWGFTAPPLATSDNDLQIAPQSLALDKVANLAINHNVHVSIGVDGASAQYCNGHRFGPYSDDFHNLVPAIGCYAATEIPAWLSTFSGHTSQITAFEYGNEPDNWFRQGSPTGWYFRNTFQYSAWANGIFDAGALTPGSSQTPGTYLITSSTPACGNSQIPTCAVLQVVIPSTGPNAGQCVQSNISIYNAGVGYFSGGAAPQTPTFVMTGAGGTPCVLEAALDNWASNFYDVTHQMAGSTGGLGWMGPSYAAGVNYDWMLMGSSSTLDTVPTEPVPTYPNNNDLINWGLTVDSGHSYPFGSTQLCSDYALSSVTRTYSGGNTTIAVTTSDPTNYMVTIPLTSVSYSSTTGLVTAIQAENETITSHSLSNGTSTSPSTATVFTFNTSGTPSVSVHQVLQYNGFTADTALNGKPLKVTSVGTGCSSGTNCYTASWPAFYDTSTGTEGGYDQVYVYSGSKLTTTGITSTNGNFNYTGGTIATVTRGTSTTAGTFTITTTTNGSTAPHPFVDTTGTGGSFQMTGNDNTYPLQGIMANITDTPLGGSGTSLDEVPVPSYEYTLPPFNSGFLAYPFYGNYACGAANCFNLTGNWRQRGILPLTASSPTSLSITYMGTNLGATDSASSGTLTLVEGSGSNSSLNIPQAPTCNPHDLLMLPSASKEAVYGATLHGTNMLTEKSLQAQFSAYPYTGTQLGAAVPYRDGETNLFSPAQLDISNTWSQGLVGIANALSVMTFAGWNGNTNASGNTWTSPQPVSGADGINYFGGQNSPYYSMILLSGSYGSCNTSTWNCPITFKDTTANVGPSVTPFYLGFYALFDFLKTGSSWTQVSGTTVTPSLQFISTIDSQSPPHVHVMITNTAEAITGNANVSIPGYTHGSASYLTMTNPALIFAPTLTGLSGTTATFTVPATLTGPATGTDLNLLDNMPLTITGSVANSWINGQNITVLSHSGTTMTATVTPGTFVANSDVLTATEQCTSAHVYHCSWGGSYGGLAPGSTLTFDGTATGLPIGTDTPLAIAGSGGNFVVPVPANSAVILDVQQ